MSWWIRKLINNPTGLLGAVLVLGLILAAIFAPYLSPYDPEKADRPNRLQPPGSEGHPLGTDQAGRDLLSRTIHGARVSLVVGFSAVIAASILGSLMGLLAGYFGGWTDTIISRVVDVWLSFPFILLALTVNALLGLGLRNIIITLILTGWVQYARLVRGEVLSIKEREYIEAAKALGQTTGPILFRHVLPNVITPIIIMCSLQMSQVIVAEATISFLGFGVQPPTPAWGNMLSAGRDYMMSAWWMTAFPGMALALTALGVNLFGDWVRDTLDPKLQN